MEQYVYQAKGLSEEDFAQNRVLTEKWAVRAEYAWDTGIAIGHYLAELKNGKLVGRKCFKCNRILVPPRMFCESCFRPTDEWVPVQDTGTIKTFSICYVRWDMVRYKDLGEPPEIPVVIDLDGASKGIGIMHKLVIGDPQKVHVGMRVQAVWKPAEERAGSITDIKCFKPM